MKIAIAADQNQVTEHFGHCPEFVIYTLENKSITSVERIPNPGHKPGFLPVFLNDRGVNVIVSGGMGQSAIQLFNQFNIEVIVGVSGTTRAAVEQYAEGTLKSTGSVCHQHLHHDEC
jgi:predicted Fe-Mo cluster-binding NifX family protein